MAPPAGQIRPGRYLWVFALIVVLLYALVFGTGNHKAAPRLGIDLKGGTTVTLTARTTNGKPPDQVSLQEAQQDIQRRVDGLGVAGAQVVLSGNNIIITVPGDQGQEAKSLGQTAKLVIRPVLNSVPVTPATPPAGSTPKPSGSAKPSGSTSPSAPPTSGTRPTATSGAGPTTSHQGLKQPAYFGGTSPQDYVAPKARATTPTPPPPAGPTNPNGSISQQEAEQIKQAQALRQSTNSTVQQQALQTLQCGPNVKDPLLGNDDPTKPLVACGEPGTDAAQFKYLLGPSIIDGTEIQNPQAQQDPNSVGYVVTLDFDGKGANTWAKFTSANVNKQAAFVLDSQVVSAPTIQSAITGGNTQITGNFTQQQATDLANVLKYGSLPLAFDSSNAQTISATLGLASLRAGLIAGGIGLLLVFIYCLFYYRALGVLTIISLGLSGLTIYAVLVLLGRWIGYTLDLAGVAGFIIAIGITADSFVVFFERLKDEVREGRTFRSAVPRAWIRARRTILASDAVNFLAAVVLYIFAVADVQGFAFTLGLSTVLDLLIVFLVTHPLVVLASRSKLLSKPNMSGLGAVQRAGAEVRAARSAATADVKGA